MNLSDSPFAVLTEEVKRLREALTDIAHFHDEGYSLDDLEKKYGFLGWGCCQQLQELAQAALKENKQALHEKET